MHRTIRWTLKAYQSLSYFSYARNAWTKRDSTYSRIELLGELQNACDDNLGMGHHSQVILRMANKGTGSIGP